MRSDTSALRPIVVYGTARSGTTLLTNLLLSHTNVAGLAHPLHWGAHEIPLHEIRRYWGDLGRRENYARFLRALADSDLGRLADMDLDWWLRNPVEDEFEWFLRFMDRVAMLRGRSHWVVKLDPKVVSRPRAWDRLWSLMSGRYQDLSLVCVHRAAADVLRSYLRMPGRSFQRRQSVAGRWAGQVLGLARYSLHGRDLRRLMSLPQAKLVEFEELVEDTEAVLRRLENRIGNLGSREDVEFPRNTSFRDEAATDEPGRTMHAADRALLRVLERRPALAAATVHTWERLSRAGMPLYYRLREAELDPAGLAAEFRRTGHEALIPYVAEAGGDAGREGGDPNA